MGDKAGRPLITGLLPWGSSNKTHQAWAPLGSLSLVTVFLSSKKNRLTTRLSTTRPWSCEALSPHPLRAQDLSSPVCGTCGYCSTNCSCQAGLLAVPQPLDGPFNGLQKSCHWFQQARDQGLTSQIPAWMHGGSANCPQEQSLIFSFTRTILPCTFLQTPLVREASLHKEMPSLL